MRKYVVAKDMGRDHWTTFMYVETRVVDHDGKISGHHMRGHRLEDADKYPTRLRSGVELHGHNDYDCLLDLQAAGFVEAAGGSGVYRLTDAGWFLAGQLRRWKAEGKGITDFVYTEEMDKQRRQFEKIGVPDV